MYIELSKNRNVRVKDIPKVTSFHFDPSRNVTVKVKISKTGLVYLKTGSRPKLLIGTIFYDTELNNFFFAKKKNSFTGPEIRLDIENFVKVLNQLKSMD